jgi:acetyl-CoA C-acetyltransferase
VPEAVIVSAVRTPIGRAVKGSLADLRPDDLVAFAIRTALAAVPAVDPAEVDDVHVGCALPGGESGYNLARVASVLNGMDTVPGTTVTRYCASSLQTTRMAFHAIRSGEGDVFVSAGVETVSRYGRGTSDGPPGTQNPLFGAARAPDPEPSPELVSVPAWRDPRAAGRLPNIYLDMGQTAENVASLRGITRREMDEFAVRSQHLAEKALANGFWAREITPVARPDGVVVDADDCPRPGTTLQALERLSPAFRAHGTVTAGNCCPLNDGAAALVVMSDTRAAALGLTPLARIVATGVSGISPEIMGLGPVEATRRALRGARMSIGDIDLVEINEAFAAQVIPSYRDLGIDIDRLNVNGGAIAVGHPYGMTGVRLVTTMINSLDWHDRATGLITLCVGGGQGMALILERL